MMVIVWVYRNMPLTISVSARKATKTKNIIVSRERKLQQYIGSLRWTVSIFY